jgi:hypothetical protein
VYLALLSFYGQRCGTSVDLGPQFPGYRYAACHLEGAWHTSSGKSGGRVSSRGWHDAGDSKLRSLSLHIPESSNQTPDILDEIRWNLRPTSPPSWPIAGRAYQKFDAAFAQRCLRAAAILTPSAPCGSAPTPSAIPITAPPAPIRTPNPGPARMFLDEQASYATKPVLVFLLAGVLR